MWPHNDIPLFLKNTRVRLMNSCHQPPFPPSLIRSMYSYFRQLIQNRPSTDSLPTSGQTKGSSSVMVPEASPLSIDLLSPNFSVTYALLNSHYCAHCSLIRENNRLVVTEGKNMSGPVTVWVQTHDFYSSSPPGDLYAPPVGQFEAQR